MKALLIALASLAIISGCRSTKKITSETVYTYKDSVRVKDSVRISDSVKIVQRDSVVVTEATSTGFEVEPCDSNKIKPFAYNFKKGNVAVLVAANANGKLSVAIDITAEIAYREKILSEYRQHLRDSIASAKQSTSEQRTTIKTVTVTKYVWPWWIWAVLIGAAAIVVLRYYKPVWFFISYYLRK